MKKIAALVLAMAILLMPVWGVNAYAPYVSGGVVCVTPIQFSDGDGNALTSVAAGSQLSASCEVKKGAAAAASQQVTLICAVYDGNNLLKMTQNALTLTDNLVKTLSVNLDIPADCASPAVKAYVWDNFLQLRPLTEKAVFGSNNADVTEILIDGVPLEGFDPLVTSYDYTVSAAHVNYPELIVKTADLAAKTEVICSGSFPAEQSSVTVKVTSSDGTVVKEYIINYMQEEAKVTNAKMNLVGSSPVDLETQIMHEPIYAPGKEPELPPSNTYAENTAANNRDYSTNNQPSSFTRMYSDRPNSHYRDIAPDWLGGTAIVTPYGEARTSFGDTSNTKLFTFDINCSAIVYLECSSANFATLPWVAEEGWIKDSENTNGKGGANDPFRNILAKRLFPEPAGAYYQNLVTYSKSFYVEPGETRTISIPYGVKDYAMPIVVKFIKPAVVNAKRVEASGTNPVEIDVIRELYDSTLLDESKGMINTNVKYANRLWTTRSYPAADFPEVLHGAEALRLPWKASEFAGQKVEFDLNHSATVYVTYHSNTIAPWLAEQYFELFNEPEFLIRFFGGNTTPANIWQTRMWRKNIDVKPGETVHVSLGEFPADAGNPLVLVKAIDLK